jgi:hypothetical protein
MSETEPEVTPERRPDDVLLAIREFLREDSLDALRVELRRIYYTDGSALCFSGGIFLSEEGHGHFCFETGDLPELAAVAGKIAEAAGRLRDACLAAAEPKEEA